MSVAAAPSRRMDVPDGSGRNAAIVLQARMGSRRLPGKVLAPLAGRPLLEHCVERLLASRLPVVVATTTEAGDDAIEQAAGKLGVAVIRGSAEDVLARFLAAIDALSLTHVVRATADNPAVDVEAPARTLEALCACDADYVTEDGLPYGCAVEAFRAPALREAAALTQEPQDREHVTPFLQRDPRFTAVRVNAPGELRLPELRFTVDDSSDLMFMRRVISEGEARHRRPVPLRLLMDIAASIRPPSLAYRSQ